jgi:hypothetical protein
MTRWLEQRTKPCSLDGWGTRPEPRAVVGRFRIPSHYYPVLLLTSAVLRKDCSKFWPKRYALFQAAIP